ncbi:DUF6881 domain-containing protein [Amycolatopsis tucumanensis]|uniref:DUF6881 domain-containing protein n=1 Tax=Amycolatopsis tucumanensis TaxID=401106 RepID=UPI003D7489D3
MPSYKKVIWHHGHPDEPVLLYSETGDDGYETRKVDLYRDGRQDYADESTSIGTTFLGQEPEPPLEEIAADADFTLFVIDADEFEAVWRSALRSHGHRVSSEEVRGWVFGTNVHKFLEHLSSWIGYEFDELDWQAIEQALPATDAERADGWYDYPLAGQPQLSVSLAADPGASPVLVRVVGEMDAVLVARIDTLLALLSDGWIIH